MLSWVIGAGGLLGRALVDTLARLPGQPWSPPEALSWDEPARLHAQLARAARRFVAQLAPAAGAAPGTTQGCVYWAAGIGRLEGGAQALTPEGDALAALLRALQEHGAGLPPGSVRICLASSAGAVYAGIQDGRRIGEDTPAAPTTPYAHEKLRQEALLRAAAARAPHLKALVCRISTLYGSRAPHARTDRGLVQHIASALVQRRPVHVFVPLDTLRDYLHVQDAALRLVVAARHPGALPQAPCLVASGTGSSISQILQTFTRLAGRRPLVVTGAHWRHGLYTPCLRFTPSPWLEAACACTPRTLDEGIAQVLRERLHAP